MIVKTAKQLSGNFITWDKKTMVTKSESENKPLDKKIKREILEEICTAKGWSIKSDLAVSLNRSSKLVLIEWHKDLI